jgi:hypothetical protein
LAVIFLPTRLLMSASGILIVYCKSGRLSKIYPSQIYRNVLEYITGSDKMLNQ